MLSNFSVYDDAEKVWELLAVIARRSERAHERNVNVLPFNSFRIDSERNSDENQRKNVSVRVGGNARADRVRRIGYVLNVRIVRTRVFYTKEIILVTCVCVCVLKLKIPLLCGKGRSLSFRCISVGFSFLFYRSHRLDSRIGVSRSDGRSGTGEFAMGIPPHPSNCKGINKSVFDRNPSPPIVRRQSKGTLPIMQGSNNILSNRNSSTLSFGSTILPKRYSPLPSPPPAPENENE